MRSPTIRTIWTPNETNTLWGQGPRGTFRDKTLPTGLASGVWRGTGWGITLSDFDHDGRLYCAVVNGRVNRCRSFLPHARALWPG